MKISTVSEMHNLDRNAMERYAIPGIILMENAGEAAYYVILKEFGVKNRRFVVFCGSGHNGGDGLVVARKIHSTGGFVTVVCLSSPEKFDDTVKFHYEMVRRAGIPFTVLKNDNLYEAEQAIEEADAIVDAILGTGIKRDVEGRYRDVIEMINESEKVVFSIDIPSGVNGNTGEIMGAAVFADYTITYGLPKVGNILYPGFDLCGKLYVTHISFPPQNYNTPDIKMETVRFLPVGVRESDTHKGYYGRVLFISGASSYYGAPYFSAMSFLRAGGGLAYLATPELVAPFIAAKGSEIVFVPLKETSWGSISLENLDFLVEFSKKVDMVVLGAGVSLNEETQELIRRIVPLVEVPLLIDGDGLTAIARDPEILKKRKDPTILTPHAGEMSRLTGLETREILKNRVEVLREFSTKYGVITVLKGAHSLTGYPDGNVVVNLSGNPGMATAGSGDVLTGTIAAMYTAHGFSIEDAVSMGVFFHGLAGDIAAAEIGEDGMVAGDILRFLPEALKFYIENYEEIVETNYWSIYVI